MQLDAASSLVVEFTLETGSLAESVTVTAEATPLQTDVALRKTIESKDIEQLSFSGRNPIGVVGLMFGLAHGLLVSLPIIVAFGCVLAWVRARTDSVFPGMFLHALFNLIAIVAAVTIGG